MQTPIILNYGLIAVYGITQVDSINNINAPQDFNFGTVYQISPYEVVRVHVGSKVMFNGTKAECTLAVHGRQMTIINEAYLVTIGTENNLA